MVSLRRYLIFGRLFCLSTFGLLGLAGLSYWFQLSISDEALVVENAHIRLDDLPVESSQEVQLIVRNKSDKELRIIGRAES